MSGFPTKIEATPERGGTPGSRYGSQGDPPLSYHTGGHIPQIARATITHAAGGHVGLTVDGVPVSVACAANADEDRDRLVAALQANHYLRKLQVAAAGPGVVQLTGPAGDAFVLAPTGDGGASAAISYTQRPGRPVEPGVIVAREGDGQVRPVADAADVVAGLVVHEHRGADLRDADARLYPAGTQIPVARTGQYNVIAEGAVTAGGPVFFRHASGPGGTRPGALRGDNDGGAATALAGATWRFAAAAGEIGVVELNLP